VIIIGFAVVVLLVVVVVVDAGAAAEGRDVYRCVRSGRSTVEMDSPASRVYLFHLVPVAAGVQWTLDVTPKTTGGSELACTVQVEFPAALGVLARLSLVGHFLGRHVDEEARGFAADIARKHITRSTALDGAVR